MNKELRAGGAYTKAPSAQYALQDPLANTRDAVEQARDLVYGEASRVTGKHLCPMKKDGECAYQIRPLCKATNNTLQQQTAKQNSATTTQKVLGQYKRFRNIKANPTNAFEPGLTDPTGDFNRNMQSAFKGVKAAPGSVMQNGRRREPGPGVLTSPNGTTPPEPNRQLHLCSSLTNRAMNVTPPVWQNSPGDSTAAITVTTDTGRARL